MKDQLTETYKLDLLYLRSTHEYQRLKILQIEKSVNQKDKILILQILTILMEGSRKQITLSEELLSQIEAL